MPNDYLRDFPRSDPTDTRSTEPPAFVFDRSSEIVRRPVAVPTELVKLLEILDLE